MKKILILTALLLTAKLSFTQEETFLHNTSHRQNHFGWAIEGNTNYCYISDPRDSISNFSNGSVNIYRKDKKNWTFVKTIQCPDLIPYEYFGYAISSINDMIAISGIGNNTKGFMAGAVYTYLQNGDSIRKVQHIYPVEMIKNGHFGKAIELYQNLLIIGAPGAFGKGCVYVYKRNNDQFEFLQKLFPADLLDGSQFGSSLSCAGDKIFIGAPKGGEPDLRQGAVYVYSFQDSKVSLVGKIVPGIENSGSHFGASVSANKNKVLISAPHSSIFDKEHVYFSGKAILYENTGQGWLAIDTLVNPDPVSHDLFGSSVWLFDSITIVSIPRSDDLKGDAGEVCIYKKMGSTWIEESIIKNPPNGTSYFGNTMFANEIGIWVGLSGNKHNMSSGTVYYYDLSNFTGIQQEELPEFNVYPNPVLDILTVEFKEQGKRKYRLYDINGKTTMSGTVYKSDFTINVSALKPGIYILSVTGNNYCYTVKVNKI